MTAKKARAPKARLIAVDGVDAAAVLAEARSALGAPGGGGISRWDASGVFQELSVADDSAGAPSARTLLLLYAADLAFRLRWQIRPALAEGRTVVAAPYVETAIAFGRAAGLNPAWLVEPVSLRPAMRRTRRFVHPRRGRRQAVKDGFVAFSCDKLSPGHATSARHRIIDETAAHLRRRDR